ncbi:hypothetical protein MFLO_02878 [Listeria floridensis FSL S10-1187]|uniref:DUF4064 domain-containing protein n=1 Tax=Listeria floridensis FSL S10-1187 TaxID=1265817 RepID=A0ABP3B0L5_9LIST|nr:hypothetical protein [Listeria floridensis]EUJ33456.1 hypothetical protein MFLO_02878 [Listeria floridensis FSL S10-1187]
MELFKSKYNWSLITGGIAILFSLVVQVFTTRNAFSFQYSDNLKTPIMIMTVASLIFIISFVVGYSFLVKKKFKIAIPIIFVSGIPAFIFVHIFAGMFMVICGILGKAAEIDARQENAETEKKN